MVAFVCALPPSLARTGFVLLCWLLAFGLARAEPTEASTGAVPPSEASEASVPAAPSAAQLAPPVGAPSPGLVRIYQPEPVRLDAETLLRREIALHAARGLRLAESNRRYLPPVLTAALGATAMVVGGILFYQAWNVHLDEDEDDISMAKDTAGLVLMPVGAAVVITSTCVFAIRLSRARRLARVKRVLTRLGVDPRQLGIP